MNKVNKHIIAILCESVIDRKKRRKIPMNADADAELCC